MENRDLKFVIIGAGMAGILSAIRLKALGFHNITLFEKGESVGGTWRENTYPGLCCDVPAHAYTYSFAPNPNWSQRLAPGPEIHDYFKFIARDYQIEDLIRFNTEIHSCIFRNGQWHLTTKGGDKIISDFVIAATGVLHHPNIPDIDGMGTFKGSLFHTARWDHSVPLMDKRIAVIGNGSTGVQLVSALVHMANHVTHFQRTPQWIMPFENPLFSEAEKQALRDDPDLLRAAQADSELEQAIDYFNQAIVDPDGPEMAGLEHAVKEYLENSVTDPELKEQLRPDYRAACKRLIYSPDYYHAIQQPNAQLIRTPIKQIEPAGIRTDDNIPHTFDIIALATGFKADQFMRPIKLIGRDGLDLETLWANRPNAYLSLSLPDFPNFFMLNGPNGPVGNFSLIEIAEKQHHYIEQLIHQVVSGTCNQICVTKLAYDAFNARQIAAAKTTIFATGCKSWYLDKDGIPATWPWTREYFSQVMTTPNLDDYEMVTE